MASGTRGGILPAQFPANERILSYAADTPQWTTLDTSTTGP